MVNSRAAWANIASRGLESAKGGTPAQTTSGNTAALQHGMFNYKFMCEVTPRLLRQRSPILEGEAGMMCICICVCVGARAVISDKAQLSVPFYCRQLCQNCKGRPEPISDKAQLSGHVYCRHSELQRTTGIRLLNCSSALRRTVMVLTQCAFCPEEGRTTD